MRYRGLTFHAGIGEPFSWSELHGMLELHVEGEVVELHGVADAYDIHTRTLYEFKSIRYLSREIIKRLPFPEHELQGQMYYTLLSPVLAIERISIVYFDMMKWHACEVEPRNVMDVIVDRLSTLHSCVKVRRLAPPSPSGLCTTTCGKCYTFVNGKMVTFRAICTRAGRGQHEANV